MSTAAYCAPARQKIVIINNTKPTPPKEEIIPKPMTFTKVCKAVKKYINDNPFTVSVATYLLINTLINGRSGIVGSSIGHLSKEIIQQPIGDIKYIIGTGVSFAPCNIVDAIINK
jgi:hypothetical protein